MNKKIKQENQNKNSFVKSLMQIRNQQLSEGEDVFNYTKKFKEVNAGEKRFNIKQSDTLPVFDSLKNNSSMSSNNLMDEFNEIHELIRDKLYPQSQMEPMQLRTKNEIQLPEKIKEEIIQLPAVIPKRAKLIAPKIKKQEHFKGEKFMDYDKFKFSLNEIDDLKHLVIKNYHEVSRAVSVESHSDNEILKCLDEIIKLNKTISKFKTNFSFIDK